MNNYVYLNIELSAIKNFLDCVLHDAEKETKLVFQQFEDGKFLVLDDYHNALYNPITRQEIAIRAVLYELTAIVESELQDSAHKAWMVSEKHKGPKSLLELSESPRSEIQSLKKISDLNLKKIRDLIEKYYEIKIDDLPEGETVQNIRNIVNAFKHKKGLKDFRKITTHQNTLFEVYKPDIDFAYDAIEKVRIFIKALWSATNNKPS